MARTCRFDGGPATAAIRIRVTPEQRREIQQVATENQTTVADVIRLAVNTFVADYREGDALFRGPKRAA